MAIRLTSCVTTNSGEVSERAAKRKGGSQVRTENQPLWAVGMRDFPGWGRAGSGEVPWWGVLTAQDSHSAVHTVHPTKKETADTLCLCGTGPASLKVLSE